MVKSKNDSQPNSDEFTRIFDEYRAKIEEITRKTEENLQTIHGKIDIAEEPEEFDEPEAAIEAAPPEPEPIAPPVEPEPVA